MSFYYAMQGHRVVAADDFDSEADCRRIYNLHFGQRGETYQLLGEEQFREFLNSAIEHQAIAASETADTDTPEAHEAAREPVLMDLLELILDHYSVSEVLLALSAALREVGQESSATGE